MTIRSFRAENFRCFADVELDPDPRFNLVAGPNAAGKTSLLEALAYLGRGKSFRGAPVRSLVRHGSREFLLFGVVDNSGRDARLGVRNSADGLEVRVDGDSEGGAAALAEALPLQVIDPEIHGLVGGGPEHRRRYLDWIAFHVEHAFLDTWRRYRRALKQRNAAVRAGQSTEAWDPELARLGERVDALRRSALAHSVDRLQALGERLLGAKVAFEYRSGWTEGRSLADALTASAERDRQQGSTQAGPHRGDLVLRYDERVARQLVSRGQQKLLACAMVLAATEVVQASLGRRLLLLLDDPAAELDRQALGRLMAAVFALDAQVVATALAPDVLEFPARPAVFHVEQGRLQKVESAA